MEDQDGQAEERELLLLAQEICMIRFLKMLRRWILDKCPECGGDLFRWSATRIDCFDCDYKKYIDLHDIHFEKRI